MSEELTQAAAPVSISERFSNYVARDSDPPLNEDGTVPEAQPEQAQDEPEQVASDLPEGEAAAGDDEPEEIEYVEFVHNGETKRLPKEEAIALARQGFDYTQKTQTLADQRKAFEAEVARQQQSFALQNQQIETIAEIKALDGQLAQFKDVNWHQLAENDPVDYLKLNQTYRDLKEARESKVSAFQGALQQHQQMQQQTQQEYLTKQSAELARLIPDFAGEKSAASKAKLREYLAKTGYKADEISGVADARTVSLAWKAMQYDALMSAKAEASKKVQNLPKVVKPGVQNTKGQQDATSYKQLRQQLKKTGKPPKGLFSRFV